jgi:cell division septal protein FtsQ
MSRPPRRLRRGLPPLPAAVAAPTDRRFRRSEPRPARRRLTQLAVRTIAALALVSIVSAGALWLARAIVESSWLRVNRVVVTGTARLSPADVEAMLAGIRRESILRVDFNIYRRRVLDSPWVADVTLWRRLPSTVEVRVRERHPALLARVGQHLYLADAAGVIIDEFGPEYADIHLPVVVGLIAPDGRARSTGPLADPVRTQLVARLLEAVSAWPAMRDRLSEIDATTPGDLVVLLDGEATRLHLGDTRFVERLRTYVELAPALGERLRELDEVDLRFDDRVFVTPRGK